MPGAAPVMRLLALERDRDGQRVAVWVREIASIDVDDGVVFTIDRLRSQQIREGDLYPGVRLTVPAMLGMARLNLVLDVNFGDPVTPEIRRAHFPQLLHEATFPLRAYPVETVVAEKLATMMALGDLNTRDRDWADLATAGAVVVPPIVAGQAVETPVWERTRNTTPAGKLGSSVDVLGIPRC